MSVPAERLNPLARLMRSADVFLAIAAVVTIAMIIVPLPTILISILIMLSMTVSFLVLLITMYTTEPLQFSVFPSLIILTTVYRLALNISTTRSILAHADAGAVIDAFGNFVIGGNYVVGVIIFLIIMLVNYLVIANGAVRIGEVAARFTLDAMPGKQMAIDADLNAGLVSEDEARKRRQNLEREADFFGAMDGAARFVQRDAMAGAIIVIINILGGFIVGIVQQNMTWLEALQTFTRLSIGDGLVASLPALLMSTATGIMVTNAVSETNLGEDIASQIFVHPRVILFGAILLTGIGIIPGLGFTRLIFFIMAAGGMGLWYVLNQDVKLQETKKAEEAKRITSVRPPESVVPLVQVDPLELEIGYSLIPLVDVEQGGDLLDRVTMIRRQFALDLGLVVPPIRIRDNMALKPGAYTIKIKGVDVTRGEVLIDHFLAMHPGEPAEKIDGIETKEPAFGLPALWITSQQKERAESLGYTVVDCTSVIATHLTEIIRSHAHEILSRQEVQALVDNVKQSNPAVVEELIPGVLSVGDAQKVLQNLLRERVPIRDVVTILETLADYGKISKDVEVLTEYVRAALSRSICKLFQIEEGKIKVLTLEPVLEQNLTAQLQQTPSGNFLVLDPTLAQKLITAISTQAKRMQDMGLPPIILCSSKLRLYLRRFLERALPMVSVLSYNEIVQEVRLEATGIIRIEEA